MIIAAIAALIAIVIIVFVEKRHDDEFDVRMRAYEDEHRTITYGEEPK